MSRKPMDSALPHFVLAWVDVSENPAWQQRRWVFPRVRRENRRLLGESLWETHNRQTQLTWGQAPHETSQVIENPTCLHWPHQLPACCMSSSTQQQVSGKWSDTNFPVFTGANRPGLGSTRFKICIHYSISIDLVQKQLKHNYLRYSLWGADPDI